MGKTAFLKTLTKIRLLMGMPISKVYSVDNRNFGQYSECSNTLNKMMNNLCKSTKPLNIQTEDSNDDLKSQKDKKRPDLTGLLNIAN
jgi:hypothetical protein